MDTPDGVKALDELAAPGDTMMVGTRDADGGISSRPLMVTEVTDGRIVYLVDGTADWTRTLATGDVAYSSLSKERDNVYVSLTGRVEMTRDSNRIDELWNPFAEAYFDGGRECGDILVVTVDHSSGTYWTGPSGRIGSLISFVRAALGDASDAGDHGEVAL